MGLGSPFHIEHPFFILVHDPVLILPNSTGSCMIHMQAHLEDEETKVPEALEAKVYEDLGEPAQLNPELKLLFFAFLFGHHT